MAFQHRFIVSIGLVLCVAAAAAAQPPSDSDKVEMQKKLEYSRQILDGLVTEDFDKILRGARALNEFGKRKWIENESAEYRMQNQVFWFTTGTLVMAAEKESIDGATLSYTQMTHSCVNCHKLLRRQ
ncbi:hypothetical protein FYK55_14845 [Roseiconus nitratireducens]|uniref:Cytochrome c n=1 Tax=Roseiconus nitratireducens TaxID=2605748 RepID=A0A5M6D3N0_9BACT|nr:hypothetical protein [Roseiconus nitratireducens]KAA5542084.1 hypothetical protein FYK55_14845 [Roseiconus nitratireducens]